MTIQQRMIETMPYGLERAILRILSFRVGYDNAISRDELLTALSQVGFMTTHERQVRAVINDLRKHGFLICSRGGSGGGYYLAANRDEVQNYINTELHPRAMDLLEQEKALSKAADKQFGTQQVLL